MNTDKIKNTGMFAIGLYIVDKKLNYIKRPPKQEWLNCGIFAQYCTGRYDYTRNIYKQNRQISQRIKKNKNEKLWY